jgi:nicotinate dehydrogenase subunit B
MRHLRARGARSAARRKQTMTAHGWGESAPEYLESRIIIERDGVIVARSGKVEFGQGIRTGFAHIVAQELNVPMQSVRMELGDTDTAPWDVGTFGSMSTANDGAIVRRAAIFARALLLERAREHFGIESAQLHASGGSIHTPDGRAISFAELTQERPLAGIIPNAVPVQAEATATEATTGVVARLEGPDIVMGRQCYPADIRLPGMLRGQVLHGPTFGATLLSLDERGARTMPGVVAVLHDRSFVGVVAEREEQARAAAAAMHATWDTPAEECPPIDLVLRRDGGVDKGLADATQRIDSTYSVPHIAHAALSPSAAVADVRADAVHLYVATQRPFGLKDEVARALNVLPETVHVHPQAMGGMFGRGSMNDVELEAALLSRAAGRPVLVQWTRPEEFQLSPARPRLVATLTAGLDSSGRIIAWRSSVVTNAFSYGTAGERPRAMLEQTAGRNAVPAYAIGAVETSLRVEPAEIRTGAFRSLAAAPNIFAIECFVDELAALSRQDPIEFRLRHIGDARLARVLDVVRKRSNWNERTRDGRALGVACTIYHGTYVAQVVEVRVESSGRVLLDRVWCVVDAGRIVHVDGAANQIEGGIQQAASCALLERLHVTAGIVRTTTWHDYPIATCMDAPIEIDVSFIDNSELASTGIGEPGFVPTAAALGNAIFAATTNRLRQLPFVVA